MNKELIKRIIINNCILIFLILTTLPIFFYVLQFGYAKNPFDFSTFRHYMYIVSLLFSFIVLLRYKKLNFINSLYYFLLSHQIVTIILIGYSLITFDDLGIIFIGYFISFPLFLSSLFFLFLIFGIKKIKK